MGDHAHYIPGYVIQSKHLRNNDEKYALIQMTAEQKRVIVKLSRDDLENKYLCLYHENMVL